MKIIRIEKYRSPHMLNRGYDRVRAVLDFDRREWQQFLELIKAYSTSTIEDEGEQK